MKRSHPKFYGSRESNLIWHTFAMIIIQDRPCFATPCYNGGTCTENAANYTCTCISGYDPASDCRLGETDQYMRPIERNKKCYRLGELKIVFIHSVWFQQLTSVRAIHARIPKSAYRIWEDSRVCAQRDIPEQIALPVRKSLLLHFNKCSWVNPRLVVSGDYTGRSLCRYGTIRTHSSPPQCF